MKLRTAINNADTIKAIVIVGDKYNYIKISKAAARQLASDYLDEQTDGESFYDEHGTSVATMLSGQTVFHLYIG